mmetsp:Transcript_36133/g.67291  ORF Transcript_36133/g.67291 Transcript_36133/m.67291 type:complete len:163 (-) Transcript_36133:821-1309(-)
MEDMLVGMVLDGQNALNPKDGTSFWWQLSKGFHQVSQLGRQNFSFAHEGHGVDLAVVSALVLLGNVAMLVSVSAAVRTITLTMTAMATMVTMTVVLLTVGVMAITMPSMPSMPFMSVMPSMPAMFAVPAMASVALLRLIHGLLLNVCINEITHVVGSQIDQL